MAFGGGVSPTKKGRSSGRRRISPIFSIRVLYVVSKVSLLAEHFSAPASRRSCSVKPSKGALPPEDGARGESISCRAPSSSAAWFTLLGPVHRSWRSVRLLLVFLCFLELADVALLLMERAPEVAFVVWGGGSWLVEGSSGFGPGLLQGMELGIRVG